MKRKESIIPVEQFENLVRVIRGKKVMLDSDLARIYGVPTFRFNEAVKRNKHRFPEDFMFQLTSKEATVLTSQIAMSKRGRGGRRTPPYAFTEHGALMAANILNSERAVTMSIYVVRAFAKMRDMLATNRELARKLAELERKLTARLDTHEAAIVRLFAEIHDLLNPPPEPEQPRRRIGFHQDESPS
jgi:phage regulator Rha-like protein